MASSWPSILCSWIQFSIVLITFFQAVGGSLDEFSIDVVDMGIISGAMNSFIVFETV